MYVPFIPSDLDSMTPALSSFLSALTITERVMPTRSAILLATSKPSFPSSSSKICSIAFLAEYGATVVGMEILREKAEEIEEEARSKAVVQMAISSLSYSDPADGTE
jgi:hypothetical protein